MGWLYRLIIPTDLGIADRVRVAVDYWDNLTKRLGHG